MDTIHVTKEIYPLIKEAIKGIKGAFVTPLGDEKSDLFKIGLYGCTIEDVFLLGFKTAIDYIDEKHNLTKRVKNITNQ